MSATHDHPVHPAVYAAEVSAARAREAGHTFRDLRDKLRMLSNELHAAGYAHSERTAAHARTADDAALTAFSNAAALEVCAEELRTLEAEVARLTAALAEAEERAAGPFFASCDEFACYGRDLAAVLADVIEALQKKLEDAYHPDRWAAVVATRKCVVEHGVHLSPCIVDHGKPAARVGSRQGVWRYRLRLTVTNGRPVITAERRAGGAR